VIGDGHRARSTMPSVHVSTSLLATPQWLLTSAASRGHWIALLGFCARAENGGRVTGAATWSEAQWAMVLGSGGSRAAVDQLVAESLCEWSGDALIVGGYPADAERGYRAQRAAGRKRAAERAAHETGPEGIPLDGIRSRPTGSPTRSPARLPARSPGGEPTHDALRGARAAGAEEEDGT
jgi:hypothetical protein